jgi:hypothetical protein
MGAKLIATYGFLCILNLTLQICSIFVKWHSTRLMSILVTVFKMETHLLHAKVDVGASLFCGYVPAQKIKGRLCTDLRDGVDLQSASQHWCVPAIQTFFPGPCDAFSAAYIGGVITLIVMCINALLLVAANFLLYSYINGKFKSTYRMSAMYLHVIGTVMLMAALIFYGAWVYPRLDSIGGTGIPVLLSATMAPGVSAGYIMAIVSCIVQIVATIFFPMMRKAEELTSEEQELRKAMKQVEDEYGSTNAGAPAPMGPQQPMNDGYFGGFFQVPFFGGYEQQPMPQAWGTGPGVAQPVAMPMPMEGTPARPAW